MVGQDIKVDGRSVYENPIECNFANDQYNELYMNTMQALGQWGGPFSSNLSYKDFKDGFTFFGADLFLTFGDGGIGYRDPIKQGNLQLTLKCNAAIV